jgi:hypothetical protein
MQAQNTKQKLNGKNSSLKLLANFKNKNKDKEKEKEKDTSMKDDDGVPSSL